MRRRVLASISGIAFYSTPHVALPRLALPEYEFVLPDVSVVCSRFRALAKNGGWQTLGVGAAVQVCLCLRACVVSGLAARPHASPHSWGLPLTHSATHTCRARPGTACRWPQPSKT
jgi:hypothetical protein